MSTIQEVLDGTAQSAVVCGDATEVLKTLPNDTFHVCYCDPPYGLSAHSTEDVLRCLQAWLSGTVYTHHGAGFLGKEWDAFVPGPEVWREVYRALKPGAYCVAYSSTRTVDLLGVSMRIAGGDIREGWSWIQGSGFPKNLDVSKAIDKVAGAEREIVGTRPISYPDSDKWGTPNNNSGGGVENSIYGLGMKGTSRGGVRPVTVPVTEAARQWSGYGTTTKPAYEPLVVTRKPLDGTVANNVLAHGTGALNIDGARIHSGPSSGGPTSGGTALGQGSGWNAHQNKPTAIDREMSNGRFPANLALIHDDGCVCIGTTTIQGNRTDTRPEGDGGRGDKTQWRIRPTEATRRGYSDEDGTETVDEWRCTDSCAVAELSRQTGSTGNTGTAARFFYQGKATARDRLAYLTCNPGCPAHDTVSPANDAPGRRAPCPQCGHPVEVYQHPTVKPLSLSMYHAKLLSLPPHTRPIALVPFCGTGTEAKALLDVGFRVIAVDIDPRHVAMTRYRLGENRLVQTPSEKPSKAPIITLGSIDDLFGF